MDPSRRKITKIARNAAHFVQSRAKDQGLGGSEYEVIHCIRKSPRHLSRRDRTAVVSGKKCGRPSDRQPGKKGLYSAGG